MENSLLSQRYKLQSLIGEGGSAEVWRALDVPMERFVAVKLLHQYLPPQEKNRLFREVKALSKLSHPGVVQVIDIGEHEGRPFFVMELVEGGSFEKMGPFEDGMEGVRLIEASIKALEALEHLHTKGVIHRDITPRNILVTPAGQPKVMDFGLAHLSQESRHLTKTGYTLGTPQYMAPEQAKGLALSGQADIYSFGAVLYKTFTGKLPFQGENDQSLLFQHVYENPVHPNVANPSIPENISHLIEAMMMKEPHFRPQSAGAIASEFQEILRQYLESLSGTPRAGSTRAGHFPSGPSRPQFLDCVALGDKRVDFLELGGEVAWPGEIVAYEGSLWVGSGQGVVRIELNDGNITRQKMGDEVSAPPVVTENRVYVGAWDGRLTGLSRSGRPISSFPTKAEITAAPLIADLIYLAGRDGFLYALDTTGTLKWGFQAGGHLSSPPTLFRGLLFIANENGWMFALDPSTGLLRYKVETGPVHSSLVAAGGKLIIPTWEGEIHAFDPLTREVEWSFSLGGEVWGSPVTDGEKVYVAHWGGDMIALDLKTGDEIWETKIGKATASPSLSNGYIYIGTEGGSLATLEANTGKIVFEATGLGSILVPPLPYRGSVYIATLEGRLYRFR